MLCSHFHLCNDGGFRHRVITGLTPLTCCRIIYIDAKQTNKKFDRNFCRIVMVMCSVSFLLCINLCHSFRSPRYLKFPNAGSDSLNQIIEIKQIEFAPTKEISRQGYMSIWLLRIFITPIIQNTIIVIPRHTPHKNEMPN